MRIVLLILGAIAFGGFAPAVCAADLLHVRHTGGWDQGLLMEFRSDAAGNYEWRKRSNPDEKGTAKFEIRSGKAKVADVEALIARVRQAPEGPKANDVGSATFEWQERGQTRSRTFLFPARPPCAELLAAVDHLAAAGGKKLE